MAEKRPDARAGRQRGLSVVVAGGGTGGHVYPGVAVAIELRRRVPGARISFAGTARGVESKVVPREGFPLDLIRSAGLKGKSRAALLRGLGLLPLGGLDAWRVLSRRAPDVVIGVGGYSSGPVVLLAAVRGIPTMVLEQNAVPGVTNRWLARVVSAAAVTYDDTLRFFRGRGFVSGNPVRPEFYQPPLERTPGARLLVFGGSQGAHAINAAMVEALRARADFGRMIEVTHQTGETDFEMVRSAYARAGGPARVERFLFDMPREMHAADLVVCRAGATTLSELAAAGRPAVLVPFPRATDDHQRRNAEVLVRAGAAVMIEESSLGPGELATQIATLLGDAARLAAMGTAARRLARPDAARVIVDKVLALAGA